MAKRRIKNLLSAISGAMDGKTQRERERQIEAARLRFVDGRAAPHHIAIIMDGNGRWATKRHLPRAMGHRAGVEALRRVVRLCDKYHVPMLSVYAFSTENWGRPQDEVDALMGLMWETIRSDVDRLHSEGVRLRHIGRLEGLAKDVRDAIAWMEDLTRNNTKLELNVCFNYGARAELVDAMRAIVAEGIPSDQITEETISQRLYTHDLPDPDLIVRTGGEMRLSNYLLWQAAYSEYYSTQTLWPDFDELAFLAALDAYAGRKRRYGKTDAQIAAEQEAASAPANGSADAVPLDASSDASSDAPQPATKN
jgi:undecaprenyl diphosphate synthase